MAKGFSVTSNIDQFLHKLEADQHKRLERAAIYLKNKVKRKLGGPSPSSPGDPPGVLSGELRRSIAHEVDGLSARVGTNKLYGRYLELGTSKMAARPFLVPTHAEEASKIQEILTKKEEIK